MNFYQLDRLSRFGLEAGVVFSNGCILAMLVLVSYPKHIIVSDLVEFGSTVLESDVV